MNGAPNGLGEEDFNAAEGEKRGWVVAQDKKKCLLFVGAYLNIRFNQFSEIRYLIKGVIDA
jgi:hypothetical protein